VLGFDLFFICPCLLEIFSVIVQYFVAPVVLVDQRVVGAVCHILLRD